MEELNSEAPLSGHYRAKGKVEPIHLIESQRLPFHLANVVKYICRYDLKNGLDDLEKARWYLDRHIMLMRQQMDIESCERIRTSQPETDDSRGGPRS